MSNDKIQISQSQIVAQNAQFVTYTDKGGTLRKARASQVNVTDEATPQESARDAAPAEKVESVATSPVADPEPEPSAASPPLSDTATTPPAPEIPVSPTVRKKTMATAQTTAKAKTAPKKVPAKVAAKKAVKTEASGVRTIGGKAVKLDHYEKVKAPGGGTSYHNGDQVAEKLAGKSLDDVYAFAARTLKEDEKALRAKYKHLNVGMQRMALGNRLRKIMIPKEQKH